MYIKTGFGSNAKKVETQIKSAFPPQIANVR